MKSKVILVTGASSGIGESAVRLLSELGYTIVLVARNEEKIRKIISELPNSAYACPFDLLKLEQIKEIFGFCQEQGVKLDGLVHCAGVNRDLPVRTNDIDVMRNVTELNYESFVELGKYFCRKKYSNDNSSIVAVSAMSSITTRKGMCTYAASKSALNAAVKVMAKEFVSRKIRVNAILPALVETEMVGQAVDYIDYEARMKSQFMGMIDPVQVSYLIEYLLSDKAKYITGGLLPIGGGVC